MDICVLQESPYLSFTETTSSLAWVLSLMNQVFSGPGARLPFVNSVERLMISQLEIRHGHFGPRNSTALRQALNSCTSSNPLPHHTHTPLSTSTPVSDRNLSFQFWKAAYLHVNLWDGYSPMSWLRDSPFTQWRQKSSTLRSSWDFKT